MPLHLPHPAALSLSLALTLTLTLALILALARPAAAQAPAFDTAPADPAMASLYALARSGAEAARAEAAAEDPSGARNVGARIVGARIAEVGAWPWQVALVFAGAPVGPASLFCGGAMLLDTWVLTAAHCLRMSDATGALADLPPEAIGIVVGTNELAAGQGEAIPVERIIPHPAQTGDGFDNDIALIRLARRPAVPFATITVPDADFGDDLEQPGVVTTVTGWGLVEGGRQAAMLRQVDIPIMDRNLCNSALLAARVAEAARGFGHAVHAFGLREDDAYALWDELMARAPAPLSPNMICSGTYAGGRIACSGDSGGPPVVALDDGSLVQAGIVSWGLSGEGGRGCSATAPFSAHTRVANYLPWLGQVIGSTP